MPPDGNALFSAAAVSQGYIETGQHMDIPTQANELETLAKELRQVTSHSIHPVGEAIGFLLDCCLVHDVR